MELPLERTTYFVGELVPIAWAKVLAARVEAVNADGATLLYEGADSSILVDTRRLAPGEYALTINGEATGKRMIVVSTLRRSAGSMQDESHPPMPQFPQDKKTPAERQPLVDAHWEGVAKMVRDSRLSAAFPTAQAESERMPWLDSVARSGMLVLVNPDTRPTSFFPVGNHPGELDSMSQRAILSAQANGRYPNFGGFFFGWDTTGYAVGNRRGLLTYWGWGDKTEALRNYLGRIDKHTEDEFRRRTGMEPVSESEYIAYLLSIKRPEFATLIDLPTRHWLREIAAHTKPMADVERAVFERRLDAWSAYLMGMYAEAYSTLGKNVRAVDPALKNTASVQVDHAPVRYGQYFPSAYQPLDFQYQSTWNDQVGGPDYAYQWLFTAGLLDMHRNGKPTWLSNAFGPVHDRARTPGKFVRVAAHGLPWGVSGIGFAFEGFSTLMGSMNKHSTWPEIQSNAGGADVRAGREFLDRFACLAVEGEADSGVAILFSRSQYQRQHVAMGFGTTPYQAFVILTRLGYTPRFVTEEELVTKGGKLKESALLVAGQTFDLPPDVMKALDTFTSGGGKLVVDDSSTVKLPNAQSLGYAFSFTRLGKPHNWAAPNMPAGDNDALMMARWHEEIAPHLLKAFDKDGQGVFTAEKGAKSMVTLTQVNGGDAAKYVIAVNDSHIKSQADWYQVREQLKLTDETKVERFLYDCTAERALGKLAPVDCDLTQDTARVYAVLDRELKQVDLRATQSVMLGESLTLSVQFVDVERKPIAALIPFALTVTRPDGKIHADLYRSTDRAGRFSLALPLADNLPAGKWTVQVRSQLDGQTATLPVAVGAAAKVKHIATTANERVIVRQRPAIEQAFAKGAKLVLPIFDSPQAEKLLPVAEHVKRILAARGVDVEIIKAPKQTTYWLAYDPTASQIADNQSADGGASFGRIKRETLNGNDWYSGLSGWRFGKPLILLDLATETGDAPMAESLSKEGLLWPRVTAQFPGQGRAVVEAVPWAFSPRLTTVVLSAADIEGLQAVADALTQLPEERVAPRIAEAKAALWREYHIGGKPAQPATADLTNAGLALASAPQPFAIDFPTERPPTAEQVVRATRQQPDPIAMPGSIEPKEFVIFLRDGDKFIESATAGMLVPDLRFSDAVQVTVDVKQPGKYRITVPGVYRYSERKPCWQAQWEDVIELREKLVPKQRQPMQMALLSAGKEIAVLKPSKTETKEVPLQLASASAGLKPLTAQEEVVTELSAEVELPPGRQQLLFVHSNMVDGKVDQIIVQAK